MRDGNGRIGRASGPVLFVIGKWYAYQAGQPPSNDLHNLVGSLESTNLAPSVVFAVDEQAPGDCDRAFYELAQRVRPSLIVVHLSLAAAMFRPLLPRVETLVRLRRELCVPIVGVLGDTSRIGFMDLPNAYAPAIDVFDVWDNYEVFRENAFDPDRYRSIFTPQDRRVFHDPGQPRDLDVAFVGMRSSGPERQRGIDCLQAAGITVYQSGGQGDRCLPLAEMARIYQRARIVVNFAEILHDVFACRGRVFEATLSGALLVERDNVHTNRWLVPGQHYASYRDFDELVFVVQYWLRHEAGRQRLAARGRDHVAQHCSAENYWRPLLALAGQRLPLHPRGSLLCPT